MAQTVTIYLDGQALARKRDGVGAYTEYLLRGMLSNAPKNYRFKAILFSDQRSTAKLLSPKGERFQYIYLPFPRKLYAILYRLIPLPINAWLPERPDAVWYPNFSCFPFVYGTRRVLTIHDFTYLHFPAMVEKRNLSYLRHTVPRSVRQADHLVTVSKHVASEVQKFLNSTVPNTTIYPPVRLSKNPKQPMAKLPKQYILFVGTLEPRKNIPGLLKVYMQLPKSIRQNYKLVVAGRKGWISPGDFAKLQAAVDSGDVIWVNGPEDDELSYLYKHARLFLYMSHYEGFGMPLKEAVAQGLPIVALDTPTAREATDNLATFGAKANQITKLVVKELTKHHAPNKKQTADSTTDKDANKLLSILHPTS